MHKQKGNDKQLGSLFIDEICWSCFDSLSYVMICWLELWTGCRSYRVFFLTGPPPEFAKCWPVRNRFRKNLRVPDWPPLYDQKKSKCLRTPMWFSYLQDLGGASRGIFGGGQSRDILRGGPVKKITLYKKQITNFKLTYPRSHIWDELTCVRKNVCNRKWLSRAAWT